MQVTRRFTSNEHYFEHVSNPLFTIRRIRLPKSIKVTQVYDAVNKKFDYFCCQIVEGMLNYKLLKLHGLLVMNLP